MKNKKQKELIALVAFGLLSILIILTALGVVK